ncbi:hypothetical protein WAI453_013151 [Rhynchosporium graminicola]
MIPACSNSNNFQECLRWGARAILDIAVTVESQVPSTWASHKDISRYSFTDENELILPGGFHSLTRPTTVARSAASHHVAISINAQSFHRKLRLLLTTCSRELQEAWGDRSTGRDRERCVGLKVGENVNYFEDSSGKMIDSLRS